MKDLKSRHPPTSFPDVTMDISYKLDEGYSEDTRSQDGLESPMGMDPSAEGLLSSQIMSTTALSSAVMALTEAEKAGMFVIS